jgi:ADP-ribose pyrophosphatase YjhB (NUDIX family)
MPRRIAIADELRALATTGLHYTEGDYDRERYERILALAAELAALATEHAPQRLAELYASADRGYVTPKLDVRLAVFRDDRVLLVRERTDGCWALPGGFVDVGDSPADAASRETREEAGVEARVVRLSGVYDNRLHPEGPPQLFHIHKLVFVGELIDPDARPQPGLETTDAAFQPLGALPQLSLGRTLPLHIEHAQRVARDRSALPHLE